MDLIIGLLTIALVAQVLKFMGVSKGDLGCLTILVVLFALPLIAKVGSFVSGLF